MSEITLGSDPSESAGSNERDDTGITGTVREYGPAVREFVTSGVLTGVGGVVTLGRGVQSLRRGEVGRGILRLAVGGVFVAVAVAQRRAREGSDGRETGDVEPTDVVGRESDLDDVSSGLDTTDGNGGETDPTGIAETGPDIEDVDADAGSATGEDDETDRGDVEERDVVTTGVDDGTVQAEADRGETDESEDDEGRTDQDRTDDSESDEFEVVDDGVTGTTAENEQG